MPEPAQFETIEVDVANGVQAITLNRPESLNALNAAMRRELLAAFKSAARDGGIRAVLLTGAGRGFCSGADLRGGAGEREFRRVLTTEYNPLITAIRELPKPVVAAVNGVAAGAGMSLALACDLVYAAEEVRFILAFVRIGLVPDSGVTGVLVRGLGRHRAAELALTGGPLSADEARAASLVNEVLPAQELLPHARKVAERLAAGPTRAIGYTKRLIEDAATSTLSDALAAEAAYQELAGRTDDHREGVTAFAEKRDPTFSGH